MKVLLPCTLFLVLLFIPAKTLQAQDYRLIAASSYKQNTLTDSFKVRYSWNRHEAPRSMFLFDWTELEYEIRNSLYDTMILFDKSNFSTIEAYSYRQFDFFDRENARIDWHKSGSFFRDFYTGYDSDTLFLDQEFFNTDKQNWENFRSGKTAKSGDHTEYIVYAHYQNGAIRPERRIETFHNMIQNSDSQVTTYWNSQLNFWDPPTGNEVRYYDNSKRSIRLIQYLAGTPTHIKTEDWDFYPNGLQRSYKYNYLIDGQSYTNYSMVATLNTQGNYDSLETLIFTHDTLNGHHILVYWYDLQDRLIKIEGSDDPDLHYLLPIEYFTFTYLNATNKISTLVRKYAQNPDSITNHYYYETFNNNVSVKPVVESNDLVLYPNPARHSFSFMTEENNVPFTLHIYDLKGNLCMDMTGEHLGNQIDLSPALANGVYMYRLETAEKSYSGRVQIQR